MRRHIKVYFGKIVKGFADIWHQEWEILCYIAIYDGEVGGGVSVVIFPIPNNAACWVKLEK